MKISELLSLFLSWCEEHRSSTTVRHYKSRLKTFAERFGDRTLSELKPLDVTSWLSDAGRWPSGEFKSPDTRRANIVAYECLQSWALKHGEISEKVIGGIEKPRGNFRTRVPTPEETRRIIEASSPEFSLIYRTLRRTGARPGELAGAQISQWDRDSGLIVITDHKTKRKTGADRLIGVGAKLEPLLLEAIGNRTEGAIFLSPQGKPWVTSSLSQTFRRIRDALGLDKRLVLYCTRHEHATQLCDKLGIYAASEALGHKNLQTTKRYVKTDPAKLRRNQDVFED